MIDYTLGSFIFLFSNSVLIKYNKYTGTVNVV